MSKKAKPTPPPASLRDALKEKASQLVDAQAAAAAIAGWTALVHIWKASEAMRSDLDIWWLPTFKVQGFLKKLRTTIKHTLPADVLPLLEGFDAK